MTEILLFHHAQGQTPGFLAFAEGLRAAGHVVHTPDLYDGKTYTDLDEGVGYAKEIGFGTIEERGRLAAESLPLGDCATDVTIGLFQAPDWPVEGGNPDAAAVFSETKTLEDVSA